MKITQRIIIINIVLVFIYLIFLKNLHSLDYISYAFYPAFAIVIHALVCLVLIIIYSTTKIVSDDLYDYVRGFFLSFFLVLLIGFSVCSFVNP